MNSPRPFLFFATLPPLCIIVNTNYRMKNGVGLGTRLLQKVVLKFILFPFISSDLWLHYDQAQSLLTYNNPYLLISSMEQSLDVCFNHDSVLKPGVLSPNTPSSTTSPVQTPTGWIFRDGLQDSLAGFHLAQHCRCYHSNGNSNPEQDIVPVTVSSMQYSKTIGM